MDAREQGGPEIRGTPGFAGFASACGRHGMVWRGGSSVAEPMMCRTTARFTTRPLSRRVQRELQKGLTPFFSPLFVVSRF